MTIYNSVYQIICFLFIPDKKFRAAGILQTPQIRLNVMCLLTFDL
jgi:hypothetical protein